MWLIFVMGCLMVTAVLIHLSINPDPSPTLADIYRVILATGSAGISHLFFGFIRIKGKINNLSIHAGGPLAVFCLVLFSISLKPSTGPTDNQLPESEKIQQTVEEGGVGAIHTGDGDIVIGSHEE